MEHRGRTGTAGRKGSKRVRIKRKRKEFLKGGFRCGKKSITGDLWRAALIVPVRVWGVLRRLGNAED
jgi:hypothetical protein